MVWAFWNPPPPSPHPQPPWHTSFCEATLSKPTLWITSAEQVFTHLNQWGTFSFKALQRNPSFSWDIFFWPRLASSWCPACAHRRLESWAGIFRFPRKRQCFILYPLTSVFCFCVSYPACFNYVSAGGKGLVTSRRRFAEWIIDSGTIYWTQVKYKLVVQTKTWQERSMCPGPWFHHTPEQLIQPSEYLVAFPHRGRGLTLSQVTDCIFPGLTVPLCYCFHALTYKGTNPEMT